MWAGIAAFFTGLFSSQRAQDTAIDALRKMGGLDEMTAKERADWLLNYIAATKHQSKTRRFIAILLTMTFVLFVLTWLINAGVGYYLGIEVALEFAGAVKMFFESIIFQPFNLILTFYFVVQIGQKFSGK